MKMSMLEIKLVRSLYHSLLLDAKIESIGKDKVKKKKILLDISTFLCLEKRGHCQKM